MLSVAGTVDIDPDRVHREAIEDRSGEGGVTEVATPVAEHDVRGDGGGGLAVPPVDEVVEGVGGGWLVAALLDLPEPDVVDDQELRPCPGLESACVGAICEPRVKVVEEVDAARVAHTHTLFACAHGKGFEDVALARPALARDDEVVATTDKVEARELEDERLVEGGLEVPVEGLE
jgi:hypothetical protein